MAILGYNDLKKFALPATWDAAMLEKIRLATGETYEQFTTEVAQALSVQNGQLLASPLISNLVSTTTERAVEYRVGVANGFQAHTEYGRPDPRRAATTGHMLPLLSFDRAFGWTWDFLRKARRIQLDADIESGMADLRNIWVQKILTRLFKSTYDAVGSGKSVPICDGGTADSTYIPPMMPDRASAFASSHTHLLRLDGITQANLNTAVTHLWEHGHDAPYELLVAEADIGSWVNTATVTGYVPRADPLIRYGTQTDLAALGGQYIGAVETQHGACRLLSNARIPTKYWAVYKSGGPLDQRNLLKVCYSAGFGIGAVLLAGDHIREFPLENAILFAEFGVGIGDRTAAVIVYNHTTGNYTDPTIS